MHYMKKGNIVLLNGVTSAGKTTLVKELQAVFDEPYYYVALDTFNDVVCPFTAGKGKFQDPEIMNRAVFVMHLLIRDFSRKGLNVVVDHILLDYGKWFNDCIDILHEYPVIEKMHKHGIYDVTISNSDNTIEENAIKIKQALLNRNEWTAFKQLKLIIDKKIF